MIGSSKSKRGPQGSMAGPIQFNAFTNALQDHWQMLSAASELSPNRRVDNRLEGTQLFRGTSSGWRNDPAQTSPSSMKNSAKALLPGCNVPRKKDRLGLTGERAALQEKMQGSCSRDQQPAVGLCSEELSHTWVCISKSAAGAGSVSCAGPVQVKGSLQHL